MKYGILFQAYNLVYILESFLSEGLAAIASGISETSNENE